jgi:hypothetical protein
MASARQTKNCGAKDNFAGAEVISIAESVFKSGKG